jgi:antitoxin YefM
MTNGSMDTMTYTSVRANLAQAMDRVCDGRKPLRITRDEGQAVVLLSLKDYESLAETAYLLRTPANAGRVLAAIDQLETPAGMSHQVNIVSQAAHPLRRWRRANSRFQTIPAALGTPGHSLISGCRQVRRISNR